MESVNTRYSFFFAVSICVFFLAPSITHGALLYLDPGATSVYRGDTITLNLRLDTDEEECINTLDAIIHYDPSIRAVDTSRGNSILNIWVEEPRIDEENHTITFAGGLPGGYCGRIPGDPNLTNTILELVFRSPGLSIGGGDNPTARVWIDEASQALLHDGYGTVAPLRLENATIELLPGAGTAVDDSWNTTVVDDEELPADFTITLTKDDTAFGGKYFIIFNSIDKQSGIDHYEVMEEPFREFYAFKWGGADAPWTTTESPYVLNDQSLNSTIRVKVIDKAGNERIATLVPDAALRDISQDLLLTILVVGGAVVLLVSLAFYALWRRRQKILKEQTTDTL